ncbi:O-antigen ligase family protein [Myroides fluvii]|uniref:O-antigen ligase family protein n=1 Tax=Myroides fluvii TaxID=2572594 RepID=UPI00131AA256|nr:O-antigen ligase family protein [Myroides fluvii]
MEKVKRYNLFWIFCSLMIYSYIPSIIGLSPFFVTVFFQGFGIVLSLIVINYGVRTNTFLVDKYSRLLFLFWLLYFLRMLYSLYFDKTLKHSDYLYEDINKYVTYNFQLGLLIMSLSTYKIKDLEPLLLWFYKVLFIFCFISLFFNLMKEDAQSRADANSYIPTLLYGQYGASLFLLSIIIKMNNTDKKVPNLLLITGMVVGLITVIIAGSRSGILAVLLAFLFYSIVKKGNSILSFLFKIVILFCTLIIYFNVSASIEVLAYFAPEFGDRLGKVFLAQQIDLGPREILFNDAVIQFLEAPFFGSHFVLTFGMGKGWYPHNIFLESLINVGVVGVVFLL